MREEKYDISGMHCAACSASVERVTRKLPGVERSDVNLTTGIMTICYDESQVGEAQIVAKVQKAGFGAALHAEKQEDVLPETLNNDDAELQRKKTELLVAGVFSVVLLYVSMGQMLPFGLPSLPLPDLFSMHTHPVNFAILQLLLTIPVLYCGRNFFISGFKALFHGAPNMDSLVAIGSACSFAYSVVMTFLISDHPHTYVHNLYSDARFPRKISGKPEYAKDQRCHHHFDAARSRHCSSRKNRPRSSNQNAKSRRSGSCETRCQNPHGRNRDRGRKQRKRSHADGRKSAG